MQPSQPLEVLPIHVPSLWLGVCPFASRPPRLALPGPRAVPGGTHLRHTRMIRPDYASRFACLGSACEENCCSGWLVSIDEITCRKYDALEHSPLRSLIEDSIVRTAAREDPQAPCATIRMLPSGQCPLLSENGLCRIQVEHGESYLSPTCANYPRTRHTIDGLEETTLSLSCPEAARLVLLSPSLLPGADAPGYQLTWDETAAIGNALRPYFWQIRAFLIGLILNRDYPLWQRLFLMGSFCRRLQALSLDETDRKFPEILDDFSRAVAAPGLSASIETIAADLPLQLEIVLELIRQRVNNTPIGSGLHGVLTDFVAGVGHSQTAAIEYQAARYAKAYQRYYVPFFRRRPQILENYLVNFVLRDAFPFANRLFLPGAEPEPAKAFAMFAIQFSLIKGLLIGVAGARGRRFSTADVLRTIRIAFKHFEHNPRFLAGAYNMLAARGLNDARGLAMLLRN